LMNRVKKLTSDIPLRGFSSIRRFTMFVHRAEYSLPKAWLTGRRRFLL
jgi:hypothetical protein